MRDAHGGVGRIDRLSAGAAGPVKAAESESASSVVAEPSVPVLLSGAGWYCSSLSVPGAATADGATTSISSVLPRSSFVSLEVVLVERACGAVPFAAAWKTD